MGSNSTSKTQTQTTQGPPGQSRNINTLLDGAFDYFNQGGREFFPGDVIADFDPNQISGQNMVTNFATGLGTDLASNAINANNRLLDPSMLDPMSQPGFSSTIDDILRRSTQNLNENILPGIRGGGTASGQFGGTAQQSGQGLAAGRTAEANRGMIGDLTLGAHGQGLQAMLQAIGLSPAMFNLGMAPGQAVAGVGEARQNQAQNEIQGEVARHEFGQNEEMNQLRFLREITGNVGELGGKQTSTGSQATQGSGANQALGTALAVASLINPALGVFGGLASTALRGGQQNPTQGLTPFTPMNGGGIGGAGSQIDLSGLSNLFGGLSPTG